MTISLETLKSAALNLKHRLDDDVYFRDRDGTFDPDFIRDVVAACRALARMAERFDSHNCAARDTGANKDTAAAERTGETVSPGAAAGMEAR